MIHDIIMATRKRRWQQQQWWKKKSNKKSSANRPCIFCIVWKKCCFDCSFFQTFFRATGIGCSQCRWLVHLLVFNMNFLSEFFFIRMFYISFRFLKRIYLSFALALSLFIFFHFRKRFVRAWQPNSCYCHFICIINVGICFCIHFDNETVERGFCLLAS